MKIQILADLHLEFMMTGGRLSGQAQAMLDALYNTEADVTVLAGDTYTKGRSCRKVRDLVPEDRPVVIVAGNHEHYGDTYQYSMARMKKDAAETPGVHFLENKAVEIGDVVFLGCTLWSDMRLFEKGPYAGLYSYMETVQDCQAGMNDYLHIRYQSGGSYRHLRPADTILIHQKSVAWLKEQFEIYKGRKIVVVTHHAPSFRSIHESYHQDIVSAAYASHLDDLVEASGAALWIHGHNHEVMRYHIGQTEIICNCYGYDFEIAGHMGFRADLVVEV